MTTADLIKLGIILLGSWISVWFLAGLITSTVARAWFREKEAFILRMEKSHLKPE